MLTTDSAWALLEVRPARKETAMYVKAVLKFWHAGRLVQPGECVELPDTVAHEVMTAGKAVLAESREPSMPPSPSSIEETNYGTANEVAPTQSPEDVQSVN
jgi:hypothetical protein